MSLIQTIQTNISNLFNAIITIPLTKVWEKAHEDKFDRQIRKNQECDQKLDR